MTERPPRVSILKWGLGLSAFHLAMTAALVSFHLRMSDALVVQGRVPPVLDDPLQVGRQFAMAGLMLLHLPVALAAESRLPVPMALVWVSLGVETLAYGFGVAAVVRAFARPPRVFFRFRLPFVTRPFLRLGLTLAAVHVALSAALHFGGLLAGGYGSPRAAAAARESLALLHPWLLDGGFRPFMAAEPGVVAACLFDGLAWGLVAAWIVGHLRRTLGRPAAHLATEASP